MPPRPQTDRSVRPAREAAPPDLWTESSPMIVQDTASYRTRPCGTSAAVHRVPAVQLCRCGSGVHSAKYFGSMGVAADRAAFVRLILALREYDGRLRWTRR